MEWKTHAPNEPDFVTSQGSNTVDLFDTKAVMSYVQLWAPYNRCTGVSYHQPVTLTVPHPQYRILQLQPCIPRPRCNFPNTNIRTKQASLTNIPAIIDACAKNQSADELNTIYQRYCQMTVRCTRTQKPARYRLF